MRLDVFVFFVVENHYSRPIPKESSQIRTCLKFRLITHPKRLQASMFAIISSPGREAATRDPWIKGCGNPAPCHRVTEKTVGHTFMR
jgi:hypothetical protein